MIALSPETLLARAPFHDPYSNLSERLACAVILADQFESVVVRQSIGRSDKRNHIYLISLPRLKITVGVHRTDYFTIRHHVNDRIEPVSSRDDLTTRLVEIIMQRYDTSSS